MPVSSILVLTLLCKTFCVSQVQSTFCSLYITKYLTVCITLGGEKVLLSLNYRGKSQTPSNLTVFIIRESVRKKKKKCTWTLILGSQKTSHECLSYFSIQEGSGMCWAEVIMGPL